MHLADAFIQSDLHCIQVTVLHFLSALAFPGNRTHDLGLAFTGKPVAQMDPKDIFKDPKYIFKLNFSAAIKSLKSTIEKWRLLPLSLIGRVNAIKMVVLPRFLYPFQNLPICLTKSFFKNLDSIIFPFIWSFKTHRISKAHLEKSKEMGGWQCQFFNIIIGPQT